MPKALTATATTTINAPAAKVWDALVEPAKIEQYFFGADVVSDFKEGSPIVYKGEFNGKSFEDKGSVLKVEPEKTLVCTHWSPLSGTPDSPENYHEVTYSLTAAGTSTQVSISQDNNGDEAEKQHSEQNWQTVLKNLKQFLEK
ncbi:MAG: SRPBCC domain-containing protein [Dehalococcoidia bacterium]